MRENIKETTFKNQVSKTGFCSDAIEPQIWMNGSLKNGVETIFTNNNASNIELVVKFCRKTETV